MPFSTAQSIIDWLIDGARSQPLAEGVLTELCERLTEAGVPLSRVMVFVRTLHPEVVGRRFVWTPDKGTVISEGSFELLERDTFRNSPMAEVSRTGLPLRRHLADPGCVMDYSILPDLKKEGVTDYLVSPLIFTEGEIHFVSWATQQPGGFTEMQMTVLDSLVAPLARVAEVRAMRRVAVNLLSTYVGENSGARVLAGQIRRGFTEEIHAAIWLSDMRGFTTLADRLPPQQLVDLLNRYFDCQVPAILEHKGEVLKFMGDGLLAIFPTGTAQDSASVCSAALKAARAARAKVAELHAESEDDAGVRFGLALHLGDVLYGNIGSGNRLDFTCIGPAVNLAARLEKIAGRLGRSIIASRVFAEHCGGGNFHPVGQFAVAGFADEQPAFGLHDEDRK